MARFVGVLTLALALPFAAPSLRPTESDRKGVTNRGLEPLRRAFDPRDSSSQELAGLEEQARARQREKEGRQKQAAGVAAPPSPSSEARELSKLGG